MLVGDVSLKFVPCSALFPAAVPASLFSDVGCVFPGLSTVLFIPSPAGRFFLNYLRSPPSTRFPRVDRAYLFPYRRRIFILRPGAREIDGQGGHRGFHHFYINHPNCFSVSCLFSVPFLSRENVCIERFPFPIRIRWFSPLFHFPRCSPSRFFQRPANLCHHPHKQSQIFLSFFIIGHMFPSVSAPDTRRENTGPRPYALDFF